MLDSQKETRARRVQVVLVDSELRYVSRNRFVRSSVPTHSEHVSCGFPAHSPSYPSIDTSLTPLSQHPNFQRVAARLAATRRTTSSARAKRKLGSPSSSAKSCCSSHLQKLATSLVRRKKRDKRAYSASPSLRESASLLRENKKERSPPGQTRRSLAARARRSRVGAPRRQRLVPLRPPRADVVASPAHQS